MAQQPSMNVEDWAKLQELLGQAQQSSMVGELLVSIGIDDGLAQHVNNEADGSQQSVIRPKVKAKQSGMGSRDVPVYMDTPLWEPMDQGRLP